MSADPPLPSTRNRWGPVLQYGFGGFLCLLAIGTVWVSDAQWYVGVGILCAAAIIVLGQRRVFRPGVRRTDDEVVCRYIPWYEGNAYLMCVLLPLIGVCGIAAGRDPDAPAWIQICGIGLLVAGLLLLWSVVHVWRRSVLRLHPSALTMRSGMLGSKPIEIRRDQVASITGKAVPNPAYGGRSLQVEISYRPTDLGNGQSATTLLGMQLTVQPTNLLDALIAWQDGAGEDPTELLDRVERILRGLRVRPA